MKWGVKIVEGVGQGNPNDNDERMSEARMLCGLQAQCARMYVYRASTWDRIFVFVVAAAVAVAMIILIKVVIVHALDLIFF